MNKLFFLSLLVFYTFFASPANIQELLSKKSLAPTKYADVEIIFLHSAPQLYNKKVVTTVRTSSPAKELLRLLQETYFTGPLKLGMRRYNEDSSTGLYYHSGIVDRSASIASLITEYRTNEFYVEEL